MISIITFARIIILMQLVTTTLSFVTHSWLGTTAIQSSISSSAVFLKIPFVPKAEKSKSDDENEEEKKIGLSGLFQLITAGMGSPFLGDFEGVDKETGKFMFSLEANNLVDEVCNCSCLSHLTIFSLFDINRLFVM